MINTQDTAVHSEMLTAALDYAANGWKVLPCEADGPDAKSPWINRGWHGASADPEVIKHWWGEKPDALIGAVVPDALAVLDLDPRNGGSLRSLWQVTGPLPPTLTCWSGRNDGGHHLYFMRPAGDLTGRRLPAGIDLKDGGKGYCIMPPSIHPATGLPYVWETHPIAVMPGSLRALLRRPRAAYIGPSGGDKSGTGLIRTVRDAEPGKRHGALLWAANRAHDDGILDELADKLIAASIESGHDERDAETTVWSVMR
jgi:hypothetical protein